MTATSDKHRAIVVLGFGAVLINTMPVWIAEIARGYSISDTTAGLLGSVVLLTAAMACGGLTANRAATLAGAAVVLVPLSLVVLAVPFASSASLSLIACVVLGGSLGVLTARALRESNHPAELQQTISHALALGLLTALLIYLALPLSGLNPLWCLAALSLSLLVATGSERLPHQDAGRIGTAFWSNFPLLQFPFFVMMGAYWTFIEIFASSLAAEGDLSFWLLGSLLTGATGSFLASKIGAKKDTVRDGAFLFAAISGAISYCAPSFAILGISVLANGFFLFLYFPLYLAARSIGKEQAGASIRMATYLLGFAFGGAVGAGVLHLAGFAGLALAIAATGFLGLVRSAIRFRS